MILCFALGLVQPSPPDAREWIRRLGSEDPAMREQATRELEKLGRQAKEELEKAARGQDAEVAATAGDLLKVLQIREEMPPSLERSMPGVAWKLAAGEWRQTFLAAEESGMSKEGLAYLAVGTIKAGFQHWQEFGGLVEDIVRHKLIQTVPQIVKLLADPDGNVRIVAASALGRLGAKETALEIVKLLQDREAGRVGAWALERLEARETAPEIAKLLAHESGTVRCTAAELLGRLGAKDTAPEIVKLLTDPEYPVRVCALDALRALGAKETAPGLARLLAHADQEVRTGAAYLLAKLGGKEAAPEIVRLLADADSGVRADAVRTLGHLEVKETAPQILKLLADSDEGVQYAAAEALGKLRVREAAPRIIKMLETDMWPGNRCVLVEALGRLGAKEAAPAIVNLLTDQDAELRSAAVCALGDMGAKETAPQIVRLLKDGDDIDHMMSAADALVTLGAKQAASDLVDLLGHKSCAVRSVAAELLGRLGATEGVAEAVKLLADPDCQVRAAAVRALGRVGAKGTAPEIIKLLADPDKPVRIAAAQALAMLGSRQGVGILLESCRPYWLNSLHDPALFSRLGERRLTKTLRGQAMDVAQELAGELGLEAIQMPKPSHWQIKDGGLKAHTVRLKGSSGIDALEGWGELEAIFDSGMVRVVGPEEAMRYWHAWWEREKEKK
jgi:HEAT repeat protein